MKIQTRLTLALATCGLISASSVALLTYLSVVEIQAHDALSSSLLGSHILQAFAISGATALALAFIMGTTIGQSYGQRINKLIRGIRSIQANNELALKLGIGEQDELSELIASINRMSQELAATHRELKDLSSHDPLTQLFNRRYFDEQAKLAFAQAQRYQQPLTFIIGDLDHFKQINDQYSHAIGDEVLRVIASLLCGSTRESDVVARYGGEEFVLLLPNTDLHQALNCSEQLRSNIEHYPWYKIAPGLEVTMSLGLCSDTTAISAEAMISLADKHLYSAKFSGRNQTCWKTHMSVVTPLWKSENMRSIAINALMP